jgi:hypothetical protein
MKKLIIIVQVLMALGALFLVLTQTGTLRQPVTGGLWLIFAWGLLSALLLLLEELKAKEGK